MTSQIERPADVPPALPGLVAPRPPDGLVLRARLLAHLDAGVRRALTLVSAPAGTGKTVAVSSWLAGNRAPGPVVWMSVTRVEPGPDGFWLTLVEGLERSGVPTAVRPPVGIGAPPAGFLVALAEQLVECRRPVVLVLDCDVDLPADVATALHELLRMAGDVLRLVLLCRADPLLPLHLYRLDGSVTEIRMAELAFTADEAAQLLAGRGLELTPGAFDTVMARTRGWAAGLVLTSMALVHHSDQQAAVEGFSGASGTVAEYLLSEVLDVQTPPIRELLLRTSVVDVLRPGLVEELAGPDAGRALTFLERGNAFLEAASDAPGCYRYQPLFRELLRAQLGYEQPAERLRLHRAAARWFAAEGFVADAVRHAVAAEDWDAAARYVVDGQALPDLLAPDGTGLAGPLALLPDDVDGAAPALLRAARALGAGDLQRCAAELANAQRQLDADAEQWPAGRLAAAVLTTVHAAAGGDRDGTLRAADTARAVLAQFPERSGARHPELLGLVETSRAEALLAAGDLDAAAEALAVAAGAGAADAVPAAADGAVADRTVDALGLLALLAGWRGQLRRAVRLVERAEAVADRRGGPPPAAAASLAVARAWVEVECCDAGPARRHAAAGAELLEQAPGHVLTRVMLALVQARLRRVHGNPDAARETLAAAREREAGAPEWLLDRLLLEQACTDLIAGHPDRVPETVGRQLSAPSADAARLVLAQARVALGQEPDGPLPTAEDAERPLPVRVDAWLLQARRQLHRGDENRAVGALDRSLRLAAPERLRRPFREAPGEVRQLLRVRPDLLARHGWLAAGAPVRHRTGVRRPGQPAAGRVVDAGPGQAPALVVEPLTEKEREVLGHLAELLTTEEIAGAMFVSVNTVRTHVRNILRKLAVSRRNEAIRRARELAILD